MDLDVDATNKPDVSDIARSALEARPTTATLSGDAAAFSAVIPIAAWAQMQQHAKVRLDVEVGGVLIGKPVKSDDGQAYLFIEAGIPALAAESRETNITFTAEAWTRIHEAIDREYPGRQIVGWYHTHPSFGIFLSEMDVFIQRHFFDLPHQVAIVIDPVARTHGCFIWQSGVPTIGPLLFEGGEPTITPPASTVAAQPVPEQLLRKSRAVPRGPSLRTRVMSQFDPVARLEPSQWIALLCLLGLTIVLFAALAILWFDIPFSEVWPRLKSLWQRYVVS